VVGVPSAAPITTAPWSIGPTPQVNGRHMDRGRLLAGLFLVGLGALLLAAQLGAIDAGDLIAGWWPLIIVAAGVLRFFDRPRNIAGGTFLVGLGLVLLAWRQELIEASDAALIVPIGLILIGVYVLLRRPRGSLPPMDTPTVDLVAVFGEQSARVTGEVFEGGKATAVLGDVDLDLREARLPGSGARLELVAVLGDVDVIVPSGWNVSVDGPVVLGDTTDRTLPGPAGAPRLEVRATSVLGDVTVTTDASAPARTS
jgi:predicted membrane protein